MQKLHEPKTGKFHQSQHPSLKPLWLHCKTLHQIEYRLSGTLNMTLDAMIE